LHSDFEELPAERGIEVDDITIYIWVQRFTPALSDAVRPCAHAVGDRSFVDESKAPRSVDFEAELPRLLMRQVRYQGRLSDRLRTSGIASLGYTTSGYGGFSVSVVAEAHAGLSGQRSLFEQPGRFQSGSES